MDVKKEMAVLNEGCFSYIMSYTSPMDVCKWSTVSKVFRSAAKANFVWEKFLPTNYREIFPTALLDQFSAKKKKKLFLKLLTSYVILKDNNHLSMSVNKLGKIIYMVSAKELTISWAENPDRWKWVPDADSRFGEVIKLVTVCWLDMKCKFDTHLLSPNTKYNVYLIMKLTCDAYGLAYPPGISYVKFVEEDTRNSYRIVYFDDGSGRSPPQPQQDFLNLMPQYFIPTHFPNGQQVTYHDYRFPNNREDGWMELEVGEFYNREGDDGAIDIFVGETKILLWKSGLVVEGIELRPAVDHA